MVILVVEDEVLIGMELCMVLRVAGYRVWGPAGSVDRALELAVTEQPQVAVVDINLDGDAEGLALARALRDSYSTTCIFLTAQPARARQARDAAIGVIEKPYNPDSVVRAIEYAAAARAGKPLGEAPPGLELFH
jgi:two-component system, response regulator PdtaR